MMKWILAAMVMALCATARGEEKTVRVLTIGNSFAVNAHGKYLVGCVWYEFLFGKTVVGNPFVPAGITAEDAAILQRIAHRVVSEGKRPEIVQP